MNCSPRTVATVALVGLSVLFFGVAVYVHLAFAAQAAFADRIWDVFYLTFGGTLVILKSDAGDGVNPKQAPNGAGKENE